MPTSGQGPMDLEPTWIGYVATTMDALILFQLSLNGPLFHVPRRPHDRERAGLIVSGNTFIYEEQASGIKRWTDGFNWSPSRILGNFLIYRELEKPFAPGEKKRAMKKNRNGITKPADRLTQRNVPNNLFGDGRVLNGTELPTLSQTHPDLDRGLVGSLVDSYPFKEKGLIKKTISIAWRGIPHHLVSYYNIDDVKSGKLLPISQMEEYRNVMPCTELLESQNFRVPLDHEEMQYGAGRGLPTPFDGMMEGWEPQQVMGGMGGMGGMSPHYQQHQPDKANGHHQSHHQYIPMPHSQLPQYNQPYHNQPQMHQSQHQMHQMHQHQHQHQHGLTNLNSYAPYDGSVWSNGPGRHASVSALRGESRPEFSAPATIDHPSRRSSIPFSYAGKPQAFTGQHLSLTGQRSGPTSQQPGSMGQQLAADLDDADLDNPGLGNADLDPNGHSYYFTN
ncbi:camp independent regulatory protein [Lasiosphaeria ovina]|uniref:Camp independent regulatory protein n=1 Tax=Lasiosphaeria ovina TaxID=92902 RepID=A0AAE0NDQ3_9PEZI|nr:camp independent regulatory protein [Lasiosphaeria ovina]